MTIDTYVNFMINTVVPLRSAIVVVTIKRLLPTPLNNYDVSNTFYTKFYTNTIPSLKQPSVLKYYINTFVKCIGNINYKDSVSICFVDPAKIGVNLVE